MKKDTKKQPKVNQYTGRERKWVCGNCRRVDELLEFVETFYAAWYRGMGCGGAYMVMPNEALKEFSDTLGRMAKGMANALAQKEGTALTESELRYCELEGIEPGDYLKAKEAR